MKLPSGCGDGDKKVAQVSREGLFDYSLSTYYGEFKVSRNEIEEFRGYFDGLFFNQSIARSTLTIGCVVGQDKRNAQD